MIPTGALAATLHALDTDPKYGPVGAPLRKHGHCTCRNNPNWPGCSLCQDWFRCKGCRYCDMEYVLDMKNETPKGKPHCLRQDCATCKGGDYCGRERERLQ